MSKRTVCLIAVLLLIPLLVQAASLTITWVDTSDNESNFQLERSVTGNTVDFAMIAAPGANIQIYVDDGLANNVEYFYRLRACNEAGCSPYLGPASKKTPPLTTVPATPTHLNLTATP